MCVCESCISVLKTLSDDYDDDDGDDNDIISGVIRALFSTKNIKTGVNMKIKNNNNNNKIGKAIQNQQNKTNTVYGKHSKKISIVKCADAQQQW